MARKKPYFSNPRAEAARLGWIKRKKEEKKKDKYYKKLSEEMFPPIDFSWMKIRR